MKQLFDKMAPIFEKGGKLEALYPVYEAAATIFYSPNYVTARPSHVRDPIDLKRVMIPVWLAAFPAMFFGWYFAGSQAALAGGIERGFFGNLIAGAILHLPVYIVTFAVGGFWEVLFAIVRKHEVSEGFFVTSILFSLILPPSIPLWQVALGISFGVVIGKESSVVLDATFSIGLWLVVCFYISPILRRCPAIRYGPAPSNMWTAIPARLLCRKRRQTACLRLI